MEPLPGAHQKASDEEVQKLARKGGFSLVGKFFGYGLQFIYKIGVARLLGSELYGLFYLGLMIINVGEMLARLGLHYGVVRFVAAYKGEGEDEKVKAVILQALKAVMGAGLFLALFFLLFAHLFGGNGGSQASLSHVIRILTVSLPATAIGWTLVAALEGLYAVPAAVAVRHVFQPLVILAVTVLAFFWGLRLEGALLGYVVGAFAGMIGAALCLQRAFPLGRVSADTALPKRILYGYATPLFFINLLQFLILRVDAFFLGYFATHSEVGVYGVAMNLALVAALILEGFNAIFAPMIASLYHLREREKLDRLFKVVTHWVFIPSLFYFLAVLLLGDPLLGALGAGFREGRGILAVLSFGILIHNVAGSVGAMLLMSGRQTVYLWDMAGVFFLKMVANFLLVPRYGMWGAAIVNALSIILLNGLMLFQVYRMLGMQPYGKSYVKPCLAGAVALVLTACIKTLLPFGQGLLAAAFFVGLLGALYFSTLYVLGFSEEERLFFSGLRQRMYRQEDNYPIP